MLATDEVQMLLILTIKLHFFVCAWDVNPSFSICACKYTVFHKWVFSCERILCQQLQSSIPFSVSCQSVCGYLLEAFELHMN